MNHGSVRVTTSPTASTAHRTAARRSPTTGPVGSSTSTRCSSCELIRGPFGVLGGAKLGRDFVGCPSCGLLPAEQAAGPDQDDQCHEHEDQDLGDGAVVALPVRLD